MFHFLSADKLKQVEICLSNHVQEKHFERWRVRLSSTYQKSDPSLLALPNVRNIKVTSQNEEEIEATESNLTKFTSEIEKRILHL